MVPSTRIQSWLLRNQNDYLVSVYSNAVSIAEEHELVFSDYQNKKKLRKALANMLKRVEVPEEEELEINDNQEEAVEARDDESMETEDSSEEEVSSVEFGAGLVDTRKEDFQRVMKALEKNFSPELREKWAKRDLDLTIKKRKEMSDKQLADKRLLGSVNQVKKSSTTDNTKSNAVLIIKDQPIVSQIKEIRGHNGLDTSVIDKNNGLTNDQLASKKRR